jgi:hypothetical protein
MASSKRNTTVACCIVTLLATACGGDPPRYQQPEPGTPPGTPPAPNPPTGADVLTIVGNTSLKLQQGMKAELKLRYTKDNIGQAGEAIELRWIGNHGDSALTNLMLVTDGQGFAQATLTAGQIVAAYNVQARTQNGTTTQWNIEVQQAGNIDNPGSTAGMQMMGTYELTSEFNLDGSFDGSTVAKVLNILDDLSDDPEDPGKFLVELIFDELAGDSSNSAVMIIGALFKPVLYQELNKLLGSEAGKLTAQVKDVAAKLSTIMRRFTITSRMSVATPQKINSAIKLDHTLTKISWTLNNVRADYSFIQLGMAEPVVKDLVLTPGAAADGWMTVSKHSFKLKFGSFLVAALNNLVIPQVNKNANSIGSLVGTFINCKDVGSTINETVGVGGSGLWGGICTIALTTLSAYLENELVNIDEDDESYLEITGPTKVVDKTNDGNVDELQSGQWTGTLDLGDASTTIIGQKNTFVGVYKQ